MQNVLFDDDNNNKTKKQNQLRCRVYVNYIRLEIVGQIFNYSPHVYKSEVGCLTYPCSCLRLASDSAYREYNIIYRPLLSMADIVKACLTC